MIDRQQMIHDFADFIRKADTAENIAFSIGVEQDRGAAVIVKFDDDVGEYQMSPTLARLIAQSMELVLSKIDRSEAELLDRVTTIMVSLRGAADAAEKLAREHAS